VIHAGERGDLAKELFEDSGGDGGLRKADRWSNG